MGANSSYSPENTGGDFSDVARIMLLEVGFNFFVLLLKNLLQFRKNKMNVGLREFC